MPYADNGGIKIHYEVVGKGPALVMLHGLCFNLKAWYQLASYVENLKDDFQLILIDARGHGESSKPHNPNAYLLHIMVADIVAVLDDLKIHKAHFFGYSMGGWVGWGIVKFASDRYRSLILSGANPSLEIPRGEPNVLLNLFLQGMDVLLTTTEEISGQWWSPEFCEMCKSNDLQALIALVTSKDWTEGIKDFHLLLPHMKLPCLIFAGEETDEYVNSKKAVKSIPNATFVSLPGLDHIETFFRTDLLVPPIKKFLEQVEQVNKP